MDVNPHVESINSAQILALPARHTRTKQSRCYNERLWRTVYCVEDHRQFVYWTTVPPHPTLQHRLSQPICTFNTTSSLQHTIGYYRNFTINAYFNLHSMLSRFMSMIQDKSSRPSVHTGAFHLFGLRAHRTVSNRPSVCPYSLDLLSCGDVVCVEMRPVMGPLSIRMMDERLWSVEMIRAGRNRRVWGGDLFQLHMSTTNHPQNALRLNLGLWDKKPAYNRDSMIHFSLRHYTNSSNDLGT
jgi:hypothetical protein